MHEQSETEQNPAGGYRNVTGIHTLNPGTPLLGGMGSGGPAIGQGVFPNPQEAVAAARLRSVGEGLRGMPAENKMGLEGGPLAQPQQDATSTFRKLPDGRIVSNSGKFEWNGKKWIATTGPLAPDRLTLQSEMGLPEKAKQNTEAYWAEEAKKPGKEGDFARKLQSRPSDLAGTWTGIGQAAVPLATARVLGGARGIVPFLKSVAGNMGGSAAVEGISSAAQGKDIPEGIIRGAGKGVLPGVASGVAGAIAGTNKDTRTVVKEMESIIPEVSPNLRKILTKLKDGFPSSYLSRSTPRKLSKLAVDNLDAMELKLNTKFNSGSKPTLFVDIQEPMIPSKIMGPNGKPLMVPNEVSFDTLRGTIKTIRDLGEQAWTGDAKINKSIADAKKTAAILEQDLLKQMRDKGFKSEANAYEKALRQYGADKDAIRYIRARQKENAIEGGVNPEDRPGIAAASRAANAGGGSMAGTVAHGIAGAATAPVRPVTSMYHLGKAAEGAAKGKSGPLRPQKRLPKHGPLAAGIAGAGTSGAQSIIGSQMDE